MCLSAILRKWGENFPVISRAGQRNRINTMSFQWDIQSLMEVNILINIGCNFGLTASCNSSSFFFKKKRKHTLCFVIIIIRVMEIMIMIMIIIIIIPRFFYAAGGTSDKSQDDGVWHDHGELSASGRQSELLPHGHLKPCSNSPRHWFPDWWNRTPGTRFIIIRCESLFLDL